MKTDTLFYELFQTAPQTFFELLQMTPGCSYQFESITVKASEKRIDDVFTPATAGQPIYFLEVQGFPDDVIYFRTMREVATYLEQRPALKDNEWQAAVLWLNKSDDPGFGTLRLLARKPKPRLLTLDLIELLRKLPETSLTLNVLRPLLANHEREVRENVVQWVKNIRQAPDLDASTEEKLITVMSQLIEQKFRQLTYEEISKMIRLTPLAETISGQGLLKDDRVTLLTKMIRRRFTLSDELTESINHELKRLDLTSLQALFPQIFDISTVEELETWIAAHTPATSAVPQEVNGWLDDDAPENGA
jgi:predicted transposase YdaD